MLRRQAVSDKGIGASRTVCIHIEQAEEELALRLKKQEHFEVMKLLRLTMPSIISHCLAPYKTQQKKNQQPEQDSPLQNNIS